MAAKTNVTYIRLSAETACRILASEINCQSVAATDILLDAYSLNQFPQDTLAFSDISSMSFTKVSLDSIGFTDAQSFDLQKQLVDAVAVSDSAELIVQFVRDFTDSTNITDVAVLTVSKELSETLSFAEAALIEYQANKSDSISFADTQVLTVNLSKVDTVSVTDLFSRPTIFTRSFTDAFALDDSLSSGLGFSETKANVFSFSDNFTFTMILGNNSVLNASTLNTFTLNR